MGTFKVPPLVCSLLDKLYGGTLYYVYGLNIPANQFLKTKITTQCAGDPPFKKETRRKSLDGLPQIVHREGEGEGGMTLPRNTVRRWAP